MKELRVRLTHKEYPVYIENGLFKNTGEKIREMFPGRKVFIVTDSNLACLYGKDLANSLRQLDIETGMYVYPAGEESKCHDVLLELYRAFARAGITRRDVVAALGGGVTGDLAGFAASTWLRGTCFLQIPTSLLAMVDSSIGGKVAVNLPEGKNLVGSFYHPDAVFIDPLLLLTLPERHFADGMAEVVKYGCICDEGLFALLEKMRSITDIMGRIEEIICLCCDIKRQVVEKDEREEDLRMILNFGHTFGHAVEKYYRYKEYTHGEAVSIGMVFIAGLSHKLGFCEMETADRIRTLLSRFGLPVQWPDMEPNAVRETILVDKKARTNDINLVLIEKIGKVMVKKFPKERIGEWIDEMLNN